MGQEHGEAGRSIIEALPGAGELESRADDLEEAIQLLLETGKLAEEFTERAKELEPVVNRAESARDKELRNFKLRCIEDENLSGRETTIAVFGADLIASRRLFQEEKWRRFARFAQQTEEIRQASQRGEAHIGFNSRSARYGYFAEEVRFSTTDRGILRSRGEAPAIEVFFEEGNRVRLDTKYPEAETEDNETIKVENWGQTFITQESDIDSETLLSGEVIVVGNRTVVNFLERLEAIDPDEASEQDLQKIIQFSYAARKLGFELPFGLEDQLEDYLDEMQFDTIDEILQQLVYNSPQEKYQRRDLTREFRGRINELCKIRGLSPKQFREQIKLTDNERYQAGEKAPDEIRNWIEEIRERLKNALDELYDDPRLRFGPV